MSAANETSRISTSSLIGTRLRLAQNRCAPRSYHVSCASHLIAGKGVMGNPRSHNRNIGPVESLRNEFREHLETFYGRLKLAPPYDSVEKALASLVTKLNQLPPDEIAALSVDAAGRWRHFRQAFIESGLNLKHRGIIAGLARSRNSLDLPPEFDHLLALYTSAH